MDTTLITISFRDIFIKNLSIAPTHALGGAVDGKFWDTTVFCTARNISYKTTTKYFRARCFSSNIALAFKESLRIMAHMRESLIYGLSACVSLFMLSYTVHIFIGGLVSEETEYLVMSIVVGIAVCVIGWMVRDILKTRLKHRK